MTNPQNCQHKNIYWSELFKKEKDYNNNAHCVDCGTDKGRIFANVLQSWYRKKISEWLIDNNLTEEFGGCHSEFKFTEFIKESGYEDQWNKLCLGRLHEDFDGLLGQGILFDLAGILENLCYEFQKQQQNISSNQSSSSTSKPKRSRKKNQNNPAPTNSNNPIEDEEVPQSPSSPNSPENKSNRKSPSDNKEKQQTPNNNPTNPENNWLKPVLIGGSVILIGVIIYLIITKKSKHL